MYSIFCVYAHAVHPQNAKVNPKHELIKIIVIIIINILDSSPKDLLSSFVRNAGATSSVVLGST